MLLHTVWYMIFVFSPLDRSVRIAKRLLLGTTQFPFFRGLFYVARVACVMEKFH